MTRIDTIASEEGRPMGFPPSDGVSSDIAGISIVAGVAFIVASAATIVVTQRIWLAISHSAKNATAWGAERIAAWVIILIISIVIAIAATLGAASIGSKAARFRSIQLSDIARIEIYPPATLQNDRLELAIAKRIAVITDKNQINDLLNALGESRHLKPHHESFPAVLVLKFVLNDMNKPPGSLYVAVFTHSSDGRRIAGVRPQTHLSDLSLGVYENNCIVERLREYFPAELQEELQ